MRACRVAAGATIRDGGTLTGMDVEALKRIALRLEEFWTKILAEEKLDPTDEHGIVLAMMLIRQAEKIPTRLGLPKEAFRVKIRHFLLAVSQPPAPPKDKPS